MPRHGSGARRRGGREFRTWRTVVDWMLGTTTSGDVEMWCRSRHTLDRLDARQDAQPYRRRDEGHGWLGRGDRLVRDDLEPEGERRFHRDQLELEQRHAHADAGAGAEAERH